MSHILSLSSVTKCFSQKKILDAVTHQFIQGQSSVITGPSGTGKSTLLHLLAGFETPTHGEVLFSGASLSSYDHQQFLQNHIGFIYQMPHLLDELTVLENVMLKGLVLGAPYKESSDKALALLARVALEDKASQQPRSLSGGEQQRVAVIRVLFSEPSFILADEPTAHLDEHTGKLLLDLMLSYTNVGIILVSHDNSVFDRVDSRLCLEDSVLRDLSVGGQQQKEQYVR